MAARFAPIHDHLVARLAPRRGERWLDAGTGTGTGAVARRAALAGARVTGLDLAPVMIETARRLAAEEGLYPLRRIKTGTNGRAPEIRSCDDQDYPPSPYPPTHP